MTPAGTPVVDDLARRRAKALGDPTRRRIFQRIAAAPDPTTVADLTGELGLNHNAIRQHLGKLRDAALVV
ncbi:MAG TPA: helix-turn-helix domain-containing protein, partial [Acidimicrobiales bacterium]|nr:helix-turn-helix domain-containing protein [Acidimicrobiales bacterium]